MKKPVFTGVCTAMVTPFIHGKINYPMMEVLLQRQIDAGIPAVVISGTTGEAPTLSDEEKITLFRRCKDSAGQQVKIIAGTGCNSTAHTAALSVAAQEAGADALLIVSPYYNKATTDGLYRHYKAIAESVSIPVIIYNVPSRTGVDIPVSVYRELSKLPNIAGVKEASVSIEKVLQIRRECGSGFSIWAGNDDMTVPVISLGGHGVVSVTSNVFPAQVRAMSLAALNGDFATASVLQCELSTLNQLLFCEVNPIPLKASMRLIGYDCGSCRMPLTELCKENEERLQAYFKRVCNTPSFQGK